MITAFIKHSRGKEDHGATKMEDKKVNNEQRQYQKVNNNWIKNSAVEDSPRLLVHFMIEPHYQLV